MFKDIFSQKKISDSENLNATSGELKNVIFISGVPGSGKTLLAESMVRSMNEIAKVPGDWVCVGTPLEQKVKFSPSKLFSRLVAATGSASNYVVPIPGYHQLKKVLYHFKGQN